MIGQFIFSSDWNDGKMRAANSAEKGRQMAAKKYLLYGFFFITGVRELIDDVYNVFIHTQRLHNNANIKKGAGNVSD